MTELTAGYVAGVIALGIVIAKLWCPTAITFILAGQLRDRETAATWTIAARSLQSSLWPPLLQAESSKNHGVRRAVVLTTMAMPLISFLISIAGIVTPLGLYERDEPDSETTAATFEYVPDSSGFFSGTSPRNDMPFTRTCSLLGSCLAPCPYTSDVLIIESNGLSANCSTPYETNATIPNILHEIYGSGTSTRKTTLSNYFDMEWRQLTTQYNRYLNNGTPVAAGTFRLLQTFALDDAVRPVEGLVVDGTNGGIGLRNHTLPKGRSRGVTWSEDLLFLEPEVECVNHNLTIDFQISTSGSQTTGSLAVVKLWLTDRGGFVNLNKTSPINDQRNGINEPDLKMRAYQGAWFSNAASMVFFNITDPYDNRTGTKSFQRLDSKADKTFKVPNPETSDSNYQSLDFLQNFGYHIGVTATSNEGEELYDNPHNVSYREYEAAKMLCQGTPRLAPVRLNNTYVSCSLVRGVPRRVDEGPQMIFEDNSTWSSPTYTCASAVRTTIKTVTFFHNGTHDDLKNLVIKEVKDKEYPNEDDIPLWGVEDWYLTLSSFQPIWGLLHPAYEGFDGIHTLRAPSFYMLGSATSGWLGQNLDPQFTNMNLPGSIMPTAAMQTIFTSSGNPSPFLDFTAKNTMSLWLKWRELSGSAGNVSTIIKLLWTDLAASAVVGSKGVLGARNAYPDEAAGIQVLPTVHRVKYRWAFGIPAFIVALVMLIILLAVVISVVTGQSSTGLLSHRLKQVSLGRVLTTLFYPESSSFTMSPADWSKANAEKQLDLGAGPPLPVRETDLVDHQAPIENNEQYTAVPPQPHQPVVGEQVQGMRYYNQNKG
ncbi:Fc.00g113310.m01.CDS01 [Cosmosporella sp. VM-42]